MRVAKFSAENLYDLKAGIWDKNIVKNNSQFENIMLKNNSFAGVIVRIIRVLLPRGIKKALRKALYRLRPNTFSSELGDDKETYQKWLDFFGKLSEQDLVRMKELQKSFKYKPLVSVIMPTYNSNPQWLSEAVESLRNQVYPFWELCIADDASTQVETISYLKKIQALDSRIKVVFRTENGHISQSSNSAISLASGVFLAFLDHDDLLTRDALFRIVSAINQHPEAALIYSDEDKLDNKGNYTDPYFKCDWNYSLFLSQNMISHLGVYRTDIVRAIGGFRQGFEGSQDYDLALRFIERVKSHQIIHIPKVLYHWRIHKLSTSKIPDVKPYSLDAGYRAIFEHLQRTNKDAELITLPSFYFRVKYRLPSSIPMVSIIVPSRNNHRLLKKCIHSIQSKTTYPNFEILVINNNSDEPETLDYLNEIREIKNFQVIDDPAPFNFSAINNRAARVARGEFLCFLNDDTEVITPDWLTEMMSQCNQEGVGIVGAKLYYPDETLQHGGVILGIGGVAGHSHKYLRRAERGYFGRVSLIHELSAVTAACMVVRKCVFIEAAGFDEVNLSIAFNDVDFCLKVRKNGHRIVWTPYAELYHHESVSRGDDLVGDRLERFQKEVFFMIEKWGNHLTLDPAYSPNLTLEKEDFSLAWPPRCEKVL